MRKFTKILSLTLAVFMLVGSLTFSTSAATFEDIDPAKDEALAEAVDMLSALGVVKGTSDVTFSPKSTVTRQQMAAFIYRLMKGGKSLEGGQNMTPFTDLRDSTFYGMISWASENGIIKGKSETKFDPEGKITLQDAYVMVVRALGYENEGPLNYPYDYIDIAERIGLNENLDAEITYTDRLMRSDIALIIYNAFYADMNETYKTPYKPNGSEKYVMKTVHETVCRKIYGIEKYVRRVVATPSYAIDLSSVGYTMSNIATLKTYEEGKEYIRTATVCEGYTGRFTGEDEYIDFATLGLSGKADEYFLNDITLYVNQKGEVVAASATGKAKEGVTPEIVETKGWDQVLDFYNYGDSKRFFTGRVNFGSDTAYFYDAPEDTNTVYSIAPVDYDEGGIIFKAGTLWWGDSSVTGTYAFIKEPVDRNAKVSNHENLARHLHFARDHKRFCSNDIIRYYDCDQDGIIDYYWIMPMTFGQVVTTSKKTEATDKVHVGDSKYRAVWNAEQAIPEVYISEEAFVEGGAYTDGQYIFAYVAGPANYVRVADDSANGSIKTFTAKLIRNQADGLVPRFDNGASLPMYWSGVRATGHYIGYDFPGAICGLETDIDVNPGAFMNNNFRNSMGQSGATQNLGRTWEITYAGGDILLAKVVSDGTDSIANNYAYLEYKDEEKGEVTFLAGGINMEAELVYGPHVRVFIDGKYQIVELAETIKVNGETLKQDDEYFIDKIFDATGTRLCTYKMKKADGKELYSFYPLNLEINDTNKAENLANDFDAGLTYATKASKFGFEKLYNNVYRFVPAAGADKLPAELNISGLRNVTIDESTKIIINYTDEAGEKDFVLYGADSLPNFDTKDRDMTLKNAVVVLRNKTTSTSNEILEFLYCEIGGEVIDAAKKDDNYRIVTGTEEVYIEADDKVVVAYTVVDPFTGEIINGAEVLRESGKDLEINKMYAVDAATGYIINTSAGLKANLSAGSADLVTLEEFEYAVEYITVSGGKSVTFNDETVIAFFDRETLEYSIEDIEILGADADVEGEEIYFNEGEDKLTLLVLAEDVKNEELDLAKLIIVVRG